MASLFIRKALATGMLMLGFASCSPDGLGVSPILLGITPDKSLPQGGVEVKLSGKGFAQGASVTFAGIAATGVKGTGTELYATAPTYSGPIGPVEVSVENPDGTRASRNDLFSYVRVPITFSPAITRASGNLPSAIVAEDVNGDGGRELIITNRGDNTITVLLHNQNYLAVGNPSQSRHRPARCWN